MSGKLIIYRGLPGSGKTTLATQARRLVAAGPLSNFVVLAGRDHIRKELGITGGVGTPAQESEVTRIQDSLIFDSLYHGCVVHVDDMNLKERYVKRLLKLADEANVGSEQVEIVDLRDRDLETCIFNDELRHRSGGHYVGAARIRDLHRRYIAQKASEKPKSPGRKGMPETYKPTRYIPDVTLPTSFLVDIDGTVARKHDSRGFHDYDDRVMLDHPAWAIIRIVQGQIQLGHRPVFLSGRMDSCFEATRMWLNRHVTTQGDLFMRKTGDHRPDYEVKDELFELNVRDNYDIIFALDDRNQVVDLWRAKGIQTLQVADGNF